MKVNLSRATKALRVRGPVRIKAATTRRGAHQLGFRGEHAHCFGHYHPTLEGPGAEFPVGHQIDLNLPLIEDMGRPLKPVIGHELVHAGQTERDLRNGTLKRRVLEQRIPYSRRPCEVEARKYERQVAELIEVSDV